VKNPKKDEIKGDFMKKITLLSVLALLLTGFIWTVGAMEPPENLTAIAGDSVVYLNWEEPTIVGPGEWIHWDSGENHDSIGTNAAAEFKVAQRFSPTDLQDLGVGGQQLTQVRFYPNEMNCTYTINVWVGGSATQPGTLVVDQAVATFENDAFNEVTLTNPVTIDDTQELWIGYSVDTQAGFPAGCDAGPALDGYGNMMYFGNAWDTLLGIAPTLDYNWNIAGYVVGDGDRSGQVIELAQAINQEQPVYDLIDQELALGGNTSGGSANNNRTRDPIGYNVYRDNEMINDDPVLLTEYADYDVENEVTYSYFVTALYDEGESNPSNTVEATPQGQVVILPPPMNLTASLQGSEDVLLNWDTPEFGDWIQWDDGINAGNAIGTGEAAQFKVAQRFGPTDLQALGVGGRHLTEVRFFPAEPNCVYTINVWTGGSSTQPGTLQTEQAVPNPVINEWNTVVLDEPVYIDSTQELWFGYDVDTQTGYPAGCDAGPAIDGFGNMMYLNNSWDTLLGIAPTLNYNWNIAGFAGYSSGRGELVEIAKRSDYVPSQDNYMARVDGELRLHTFADTTPAPQDTRTSRMLDGYRVYRNDVMLADVMDPETTTYLDEGLDSGVFVYYVTALYGDEESEASNSVTVNTQVSTVLHDDFENHPDFALQFPPWTLIDLDQSPTFGFTNVTFPNEESPMAYIIFNPSETTPPMDLEAHSGDKMAASFAATAGPNNDWMITPQLQLGENSTLTFWARSYTATYGLERMKVGVSTTSMLPTTFTIISEGDYVEVPTAWTEYTFDLSDWDNQNVWLAVSCASDDAFVFFVDDFHVQSVLEVSADDPTVTPQFTSLKGNYPNPFNPETTISFALDQTGHVSLDIFNIKGQKIATVVDGTMEAGNHNVVWNGKTDNNREAGSGVYFYRMKSGKYSSTKKMIMMK
jgi:hypothetical protein